MTRVLHILRQLNPGGVECWLERVLANWPNPSNGSRSRTSRPEFHFALEHPDFGSLAPRFEALGANLHYCPPPTSPFASASRLVSLLADHGFTAIHCHNHHASAFPLGVAAQAGIRTRIAHSHADFRRATHTNLRRAYSAASRFALAAVANVRLAVSEAASHDLFGNASRSSILPCGIDFAPYFAPKAHRDPSRFTLVHTGRLVPEKNHRFLLDLTSVLVRRDPSTQLWLIGDGPLRVELENYTSSSGLSKHVHFWGNRSDVPDLLASGDVFAFPSHTEGLGLAAIEAQAAGLPVLIAEHLPKELDVFPSHVRRLALNLPLEQWADTIMNLRTLIPLPPAERLALLAQSSFSIHSNIHRLGEIYAR